MKKSIKQRAIDFAGDRSQGAGHGYPSWEANLIQKGYTQGAEDQTKTMYSTQDMFEFSQWISHNDWVYLASKNYWVNEEQEELEQKLSSKQILKLWLEQSKNK
jgi:hypothetical protein